MGFITTISVPAESLAFDNKTLSAPVKLQLLLLACPHVANKNPKDVAMSLGVSPARYDDWKRNTWMKVTAKFSPERSDLPELQRRALRDLTGVDFANPSYVKTWKDNKFGTYEPQICLPENNSAVERLRKWYPDLLDLKCAASREFWAIKLPRALGATSWKAEHDQDVRLSAYVLAVAHEFVKGPTLNDPIGLFLSKRGLAVLHHAHACNLCRAEKAAGVEDAVAAALDKCEAA